MTESIPARCSRCPSISPAGPAPTIPTCVRMCVIVAPSYRHGFAFEYSWLHGGGQRQPPPSAKGRKREGERREKIFVVLRMYSNVSPLLPFFHCSWGGRGDACGPDVDFLTCC